MSIKLKGKLEWDLRRLGLMPGMIIEGSPDANSSSGVVHFEIYHKGTTFNCSVWPENYDIRKCKYCGCTDNNCQDCIDLTGHACHWIEWDLCSACEDISKMPVEQFTEFEKGLEDYLRSTGNLFPITPKQVDAFRKLHPNMEEVPNDCKDPLKGIS